MVSAKPHYLLFCQASGRTTDHTGRPPGNRWHFVLEQLDGSNRLEATDAESQVGSDRLALLSVVRGLEALDQPAQVTLVTTSRYVTRGLRYGLPSWRQADYQWERFGQRMPIRNADLWKRVDTALRFHGVNCRLLPTETNQIAPQPTPAGAASPEESAPWTSESANVDFEAPSTYLPRPILPGMASSQTSKRLLDGDRWWSTAASWIKWWRGKPTNRPAVLGIQA